MRILIDTNVLISAALFPGSTPAQAFEIATSDLHHAGVSEQNVDELRRIFQRKFPTKLEILEQFLAAALLSVEIVPVPEKPVTESESVVRDADDRPILRAALAANVDIMITGDRDFLEAGLSSPKIVSPAEFVKGIFID